MVSWKNSDKNLSLSLEFARETVPIIPYIGVVFSFMGSLSFWFPNDFEVNANISTAIKSVSTVCDLIIPLSVPDVWFLWVCSSLLSSLPTWVVSTEPEPSSPRHVPDRPCHQTSTSASPDVYQREKVIVYSVSSCLSNTLNIPALEYGEFFMDFLSLLRCSYTP